MLGVTRVEEKILYPVVVPNAVHMMNYLTGQKFTPYMALHH